MAQIQAAGACYSLAQGVGGSSSSAPDGEPFKLVGGAEQVNRGLAKLSFARFRNIRTVTEKDPVRIQRCFRGGVETQS
jgi:hypothetical protein